MSVQVADGTIRLEGRCHVEDAEPLLAALLADRGRTVDLSAAGPLHTAVVQVILALRPGLVGTSDDPFVREWIMPALAATIAGQTD